MCSHCLICSGIRGDALLNLLFQMFDRQALGIDQAQQLSQQKAMMLSDISCQSGSGLLLIRESRYFGPLLRRKIATGRLSREWSRYSFKNRASPRSRTLFHPFFPLQSCRGDSFSNTATSCLYLELILEEELPTLRFPDLDEFFRRTRGEETGGEECSIGRTGQCPGT